MNTFFAPALVGRLRSRIGRKWSARRILAIPLGAVAA